MGSIALYDDLDPLHGNTLTFRIPKHSHCRAGAQCGIVEVMRNGPGSLSLAALLHTQLGGKPNAMCSHLDFKSRRRLFISNNSNCHCLPSSSRTTGGTRFRRFAADSRTSAAARARELPSCVAAVSASKPQGAIMIAMPTRFSLVIPIGVLRSGFPCNSCCYAKNTGERTADVPNLNAATQSR
jgi:hypothetical protein